MQESASPNDSTCPRRASICIVQLIRQNVGTLSAAKRSSHFADLTDEVIGEAERAVQTSFSQGTATAGHKE
jgi:hypothetical protein